jgi:hypothetical protein
VQGGNTIPEAELRTEEIQCVIKAGGMIKGFHRETKTMVQAMRRFSTEMEIDDESRPTMRLIAWLRSPGKGDRWVSDRTRDAWRNDWWLRYAHRITQEGAESPEEGKELRTWLRGYGDELWLTRQVAEWVTVEEGKWVWKMIGRLRAEGFEPEETETMKIWERMTGMTEEQAQEEPMSQKGEKIAKNLREIAKYQAAGKEQYERFFRKWGWCWDPNGMTIPGLDKGTQETVSREARESRISHMRQRLWGIFDGRRKENPEWER